jgi:cytochrome c551/c552
MPWRLLGYDGFSTTVADRPCDEDHLGAAVPRLAERIVRGSSNAWGAVPMPPNPKVTPEEARQLATWVLSLKP